MKTFVPCVLALTVAATFPLAAQAPKPKRINRAIELLEAGQPIYYTGGRGGYEEGKKMAATKADYINYEMEHGAFDMKELRDFMRGLVDAGPTRTGHRTPAVIVTLPVLGKDPVSMRANSWVVQQVLAAGVHGILLCHAESPEAIKEFVEATRYPFAEKSMGLNQGYRGSGSQGFASQIWGISATEYLKRADTWPLNKNGEIMLGLKIENPKATANASKSTKVPGIAFAEWGPGDQAFYLIGLPTGPGGGDEGGGGRRGGGQSRAMNPAMQQARATVFKATKEAKIAFLNACNENDVIDMIKEGVMICTGGDGPGAEKGRQFSKRQGPW
jgi:4-hydroxy-2-oxoheptanedioate aldolase